MDDRETTNFVRQKTPHPKELKAKAHKLFGSPQKQPEPHEGMFKRCKNSHNLKMHSFQIIWSQLRVPNVFIFF